MEFNFYKYDESSQFPIHKNHPAFQNYKNERHCVLISYRDPDVGEEEYWNQDYYNWEDCVELGYETVNFWYENGVYFHILHKYDNRPFEVDDFHYIQEEIFSSTPSIAIQEVNILLFLQF